MTRASTLWDMPDITTQDFSHISLNPTHLHKEANQARLALLKFLVVFQYGHQSPIHEGVSLSLKWQSNWYLVHERSNLLGCVVSNPSKSKTDKVLE